MKFFDLIILLSVFGLLLGMIVFQEIGLRIGKWMNRDPESAPSGLGTVEGAVFALLGLLIAFTFSGAASRFDERRKLVVEEANNIGTAWLRIDLLPEASQLPVRQVFRKYLDSRIETYRKLPDVAAAQAEFSKSVKLQDEIWALAVKGCSESGSTAPSMLLLPAINAMIDITTTRAMASQFHPPKIVFVLLVALSLTAALLAGYSMGAVGRKRSWIHIAGFALVMVITVYVIIDIEYPRFGFIRVDQVDEVLRELRMSMGQ